VELTRSPRGGSKVGDTFWEPLSTSTLRESRANACERRSASSCTIRPSRIPGLQDEAFRIAVHIGANEIRLGVEPRALNVRPAFLRNGVAMFDRLDSAGARASFQFPCPSSRNRFRG
jgi:hypothetical protein